MSESAIEENSDIEKIEAQIQGLRDEVRDMMETLGKLSHEFAKVLMILSGENGETEEPFEKSFEETKWGKSSFS
ncbi:MAG: hypothetical protein ACFFDT_08835 [Candidatus Hodarchaeota archaeon]